MSRALKNTKNIKINIILFGLIFIMRQVLKLFDSYEINEKSARIY